MFESMTAFLPELQGKGYSRRSDIADLPEVIGRFVNDHKEMDLYHYANILEAAGLKWEYDSMYSADVSALDGRTVVALLLGVVRAERFSDGAFVTFIENGCIEKWLLRLQELDCAEK